MSVILPSALFEGRHDTGVDEKGRVGLVQRYREHFADGVTVLKWDKHLVVMRPETFENVAGFVAKRLSMDSEEGVKNFFNPKLSRDRRYFFGNKFDLGFDAQGRLTVPKTLRDSVDLYSDVVWVGCGDYLELWAKKHWDADCAQWEQAGGFDRLFGDEPAPSFPPALSDDDPGGMGSA
jgi:division/cell wall cluster transcriptional repressor MraZ